MSAVATTPREPPAPAREASRRLRALFAWADLGTPVLTVAFWGTVALYVAAVWVPRFPPLVDYPQHLGIGALLRRWFDGASVERQTYEVNLVTYNASFHLLVALLSFVVPVEVAGRVVLTLVPLLLGAAALNLVRAMKRPPAYALLVLPVTFNSVLTWGFVNNSLGYAVALSVFAWLYRAIDGEGGLYRRGAVAGVVVAYLHICAAFVLCASAGLVALHRLLLGPGTVRERAASFLRVCLVLVPPAALSVFFVLYNRASPHSNWENAVHDGTDEYAWRKVAWFADLVIGNFADASDRRLFYGLLLCLAFLWFPRRDAEAPPRGMRWVIGFFALVYLVVPRVLFATWFMFERFGVIVVIFAAVAAPVARAARSPAFQLLLASLAVSTASNVVLRHSQIPDERDADAVLDAIPDGARVLGLMWNPSPWPVLTRQTYVHFQSYHLARHRGETQPSFTFIESMPVHYRLDRRPPRPPVASEWDPDGYAPDKPWASYFDTVLVRSPWDVPDPTEKVFKEGADRVRVLAHRGRFWLYDASPLFREP